MQWFIKQWWSSIAVSKKLWEKICYVLEPVVLNILVVICETFYILFLLIPFLLGTVIRFSFWIYKYILQGIYLALMCLVGSFVGFTLGEIIIRFIYSQK